MGDKSDWPIEEEERNLNYTPPAQKSLEEIQELDKDDQSLLKYKQTLLGNLPITAGVSVSYPYIHPTAEWTRLHTHTHRGADLLASASAALQSVPGRLHWKKEKQR